MNAIRMPEYKTKTQITIIKQMQSIDWRPFDLNQFSAVQTQFQLLHDLFFLLQQWLLFTLQVGMTLCKTNMTTSIFIPIQSGKHSKKLNKSKDFRRVNQKQPGYLYQFRFSAFAAHWDR